VNTLRTFVAIELPAEVLHQMKQVQAQLGTLVPSGSVRWVRPEGIHLTLKFLGQVPISQLDLIGRAMTAAAQAVGPFALEIGDLGCFPDSRHPRVVWVGVNEPTGALGALQRAVESAISPLGYPSESRGFQPHLTLGRAARDAAPGDLRRVGEIVAAANVGVLGQVAVSEIALIRSDLKPGGAEYTTLQRARLGRPVS